MADIYYKGSRADLVRLFHWFVEEITGRNPSLPPHLKKYEPKAEKLAKLIQLRIGIQLLSEIQQAFIEKSRGGTGSDGIRWQPLKRETIAQRRVGKGFLKSQGITGKRVRGLLTPAEDKLWRSIYARVYARNAVTMGHAAAAAKAGSIAWFELKKRGAKTKLDVLGSRKVEILRDTSELFRSLSPLDPLRTRPPGQILERDKASVTVGTNVKPWHHRGIPGRLPSRPLWPLTGDIPGKWWDSMTQTAIDAIKDAMIELLR